MHSVRNLSHHYGSQPTFSNISLDIKQGECVALLGESGCGKSTLLRCIAGLSEPSGGTISIGGQEVYSASQISPGKRALGFVFQDYALFPALTVEQNIAFGTSPDQHNRVQELMELVGVSQLKARFPQQLSGGQQQRVALARSLAPNPKLLLLDEPFSNVDAHRRFEIGEELREILQVHNTSAIFVTHDQTDALSLSDRVAVMTLSNGEGTIAQYDTPECLLKPQLPTSGSFNRNGVVLGRHSQWKTGGDSWVRTTQRSSRWSRNCYDASRRLAIRSGKESNVVFNCFTGPGFLFP